ncbi:MAG TPA: YbaK/EbsC family protein [Gaiellales bacterium]|jgi:Cys-tRNA(Pro)/Cys-tRNA(Cys) deacylase|nr:YbaK/EbsC family protein [Gaiellales bacterium]
MAETRGTTDLRRAGIEHRVHAYRYTGDGPVAAEAAAALGVDPSALFKTLVVVAGDEPVFALLPGDHELSTKLLAAAAGAKHAQLADRHTAERVTGYQIGGISPLGSKRRLRTFVDESAVTLPAILLNAGGRGLIVEAETAALVDHLSAKLVRLIR